MSSEKEWHLELQRRKYLDEGFYCVVHPFDFDRREIVQKLYHELKRLPRDDPKTLSDRVSLNANGS
jgi:hypothetical protein